MNYQPRFSILIATSLIVTAASFAHAGTSQIQMLPPVTEGTTTACLTGSPRVLTWDGQTALACADGVTIAGGRVGIGTPRPAAPLSVEADANAAATISIANTNNGAVASSLLELNTSNPANGAGLVFETGSGWVNGYGGANSLNVWNTENGPLAFGTDNTMRMTILADGNVGIGTATPDFPLTIGSVGGRLTTVGWGRAISIPAAGALVWQGDQYSDDNKLFMTYPSNNMPGYFFEGFAKTDDGTTDPDYMLKVDGNDAAADYGQFQFSKDVHAPNLDALQTQINVLQAQIKALQADNHLVP